MPVGVEAVRQITAHGSEPLLTGRLCDPHTSAIQR
jgi:hypothetical protein